MKENKDYLYYLVCDWMVVGEDFLFDDVERGEGKVINLGGKKVVVYCDDNNWFLVCLVVCIYLKCIVDWNIVEKIWDCLCYGFCFYFIGEVIFGLVEELLEKIMFK